MEILNFKLKDIKPYEKNPRKNDEAVEFVANSIKEFGFKNPIILDKNNVIVCGHTRYKASLKLGLEEVPCIVASDLTPEQIKAFRLADNKTSEKSEWDFDLLNEELDGIFNIDMSEFDFNLDIEDEQKDIEEDDFDCTPKEESKSKLGDIYQLGNHGLMCGDSTKIEDVEKLMNGEKADMVFTDPPYGMNLDADFSGMKKENDISKSKKLKGGKKYEIGIVDNFNPKMINVIMGLDVEETFLFGGDYFCELLPNKNNGSWIVWDKRANGNDNINEDYSSDKIYGSCFELCWSKKKHKRDIARVKWAGVFGTEKEFDHKRHHPTQKPIKLSQWFIDRYSKENNIILDLFGGSGSTLIACEQLNRNCYMMELDPRYIDVIINRWGKFTG
ncbi:MAG: DNA methyltransferase, partial [Bacilli bacterium]